VQAVPVQTVLLRSCAGFKKQISYELLLKAGALYSLVPSVTERQHECLFLNVGSDGGTLKGIHGAGVSNAQPDTIQVISEADSRASNR